MKHIGLVISDTLVAQEIIRNHVVEFVVNDKNECSHMLASVADAAFRFEGHGALDLASVKNQKRRAERPLSFGDVIEWDEGDMKNNRIIFKFRRMPPLFEPRVHDQKFQVLVSGVVSPLDKFHFWSEYFTNVRLGMKSCDDVLPNVTVSAWLNLCIDLDGRFVIEFDSFERVEPEGSIVAAAPWNRNNSKYTTLTIPLYDDRLESQVLLSDSYSELSRWKQEVSSAEGICTGKRLIFCKELASYEIVVALIKHTKDMIPLGIGVSCEFNAVWNEYEKKYIVTKYKTKGLRSRLGSNGLLRTSVKAVEEYPGLFKSDQFGPIDDPNGALALLHLSPYRRSSVVVTLEDKPSHQSDMRFRIVDVQPDKASKLQKWLKESKIVVNDAEGVVVDNSTVYSKAHGNIFFVVREDLRSKISPGKIVRFSAAYQNDIEKFVVNKIVVLLEDEIPCVEKRLWREQEEYQTKSPDKVPVQYLSMEIYRAERVYRTTATWSKCFRSFIESSTFGLVDARTVNSPPGNKKSSMRVWLMRSLPERGLTRSARTPFVVVSVGDQEPPDYVFSSPLEVTVPVVPELAKEMPDTVTQSEVQAAMERLGLIGDKDPDLLHAAECTDTACGVSCPTMSSVLLLIDRMDDFWEKLSAKNLALFTECVNKMFT